MPTTSLHSKKPKAVFDHMLILTYIFHPYFSFFLLSSTFTRIYTPTSCSQIVSFVDKLYKTNFQLDSNNDSLNGFSKALVASWGGAFTQTWHNCCFLLVSSINLNVLSYLMERIQHRIKKQNLGTRPGSC